MATRYQQGYKPIQQRETSALDALTVRYARHMEDNIAHTIVALSPKIVSQVWPGGHSLADATAGTEEADLMGVWGPFSIAEPYDAISWAICVDSTMGAGVNVAWELYCSDTMPSFNIKYTRAGPMSGYSVNAARMGNYTTAEVEEVPGGHQILTSVRAMDVVRSASTGDSWIVLFARTVDDGAASLTRTATVYALDVTAQHSAAY